MYYLHLYNFIITKISCTLYILKYQRQDSCSKSYTACGNKAIFLCFYLSTICIFIRRIIYLIILLSTYLCSNSGHPLLNNSDIILLSNTTLLNFVYPLIYILDSVIEFNQYLSNFDVGIILSLKCI